MRVRVMVGFLAAFAMTVSVTHVTSAAESPLEGLEVTGTVPGGRGELAGLVKGDIVTVCSGVSLKGPRQWRELLTALARKPTVSVDVFRDGERKRVEMVPGALDVYVSAYRRNYDLFVAGPRADPKWNDAVKAGYGAYENGRWHEAAERLQRAADAGLEDAHVLKCLGRSYLACLDLGKAHALAQRIAAPGAGDDGSVELLYWSSLMVGRPEQAARLREKLPVPEVDWAARISAEKDLRSLEAMKQGKQAAGGGGGGTLPAPVDPIAGYAPDVKGLQIDGRGKRETEINVMWREGNYWRWLEKGGHDRLRDFVFSCNMAQKWQHARHFPAHSYVFVRGAEKRFAFHVGFDREGRLLLGLKMPMIVGPCATVRKSPGPNALRIARKGAQLDAFINGLRVATVYVPPEETLLLWVGFRHGGCSVTDIQLVTRGAPVREEEVF